MGRAWSFRRAWYPLAVAVAACGDAAEPGPERVRLTDVDLCTACLEVEHVATLGTLNGPGAIEHDIVRAARDGRGRIFVAKVYGTSVQVFGADGRWVTTLGRQGGGPGEYEAISSLAVLPGDTLEVLDNARGLRALYSPELTLVRTTILPMPPGLSRATLADGRLVLAGQHRPAASADAPLHLVTERDAAVRSFGAPDVPPPSGTPYVHERALAAAGGTHVWSAYHNQYVLERWDAAAGRRLSSLVREAEWFPSWFAPRARRDGPQPPRPFLNAVWQDSTGLLWTIVGVADAAWEQAVGTPGPHGQGTVTEEDAYRDTRIEVIDPKHGRVLASRLLPEAIWEHLGASYVGSVGLDADGVPQLRVWRLQFRRR